MPTVIHHGKDYSQAIINIHLHFSAIALRNYSSCLIGSLGTGAQPKKKNAWVWIRSVQINMQAIESSRGICRCAVYYTEAGSRKSDPRYRCTATHHLGSRKRPRSPRKSLSLVSCCSLLLYCTRAQSPLAQPSPWIGRQMRIWSIGWLRGYPWDWRSVISGFLCPILGKSCPDSLWRKPVHPGAMLKWRSNLDGQLI